jgi:nitrite reductase/ring-hydroxylating ferredoxin subunit
MRHGQLLDSADGCTQLPRMSNHMLGPSVLLHTMPLELLQRRKCTTFLAQRGERPVQGLVLWHADGAVAWLNRCPHWGIPLDGASSDILVEIDGTDRLRCASHGAEFAIDTGICQSGPCEGDRLSPLRVEVDGNIVRVYAPPALVMVGGDTPVVRTRR